MTVARYLVAILGLALLMIVHEAGHYFAARKFGMRVVRFSIGFGPTLWKHKPKDSPTASLWGRVVTIAAGPLTNSCFASVLIFFGLLIGGKEVPDEATMRIVV